MYFPAQSGQCGQCVPRECLLEMRVGIEQRVRRRNLGGEDLRDPSEMGMVAGHGEGGRLHSEDLGMRLWDCIGGAGGEAKICFHLPISLLRVASGFYFLSRSFSIF